MFQVSVNRTIGPLVQSWRHKKERDNTDRHIQSLVTILLFDKEQKCLLIIK